MAHSSVFTTLPQVDCYLGTSEGKIVSIPTSCLDYELSAWPPIYYESHKLIFIVDII